VEEEKINGCEKTVKRLYFLEYLERDRGSR
jgi:hypothetical protein